MKTKARRGSALLIVLGMVGFMVVSAVAFSAWMRASRLPNSYLRRASASRMIAKAAIAEAIDDLDAAIGNNPHPGVGTRSRRQKNADDTSNLQNRNTWMHRVFIGTNNVNVANNLVETDETVSTLCLEALAYIPPALVNEARYYSRRSTAARWHNLDFDCGRYAYCAIDVSDYFDVNAMTANAGRSSSPAGRLTLAHLFENKSHKGYDSDPKKWDDFMKQYARDKSPVEAAVQGGKWLSQNKVPFVSLADLNLAMHEYGKGCGLESPFCKYIENGASSFYSGDSATSNEGDRYQRMTFVTDALYPPVAGGTDDDDYDLADAKYQPFEKSLLERKDVAVGTIMDWGSEGAVRLREKISRFGLVTLYDYLDCDNVPVSLAIPQVERTPMIAGIQPKFEGSAVAIVSKKDPENPESVATKEKPTVHQTILYSLDPQKFTQGIMGGKVKAVVAYPFRRGSDLDNPDAFKIDGHVAFFLSTGDFKFRTYEASDCLHLKRKGNKMEVENTCDGVFHAEIPQQQLSFKKNPTEEKDALIEVDLIPNGAASEIAQAIGNRPLLRIEKDLQYEYDEKTGGMTLKGEKITSTHCAMPPLKNNGAVNAEFANDGTLQGWVESGVKQVTVRMAVWLRVTNGEGETVDLVPACMMDDMNLRQNPVNNSQSMGPEGGAAFGQAYPVMRFNGPSFDFGVASFDKFSEQAIDFQPKGVICPDPRWNWAPEHWYQKEDVTKDSWLTEVKNLLGQGGRDRDIFMATSDAGYMQSVYELAFLPRLTELTAADDRLGKLSSSSPDDGRINWATSWGDGVRNNGLMWRTYCPYKRVGFTNSKTGEQFDPFDEVGFVSEGGGMKVNPYSTDTNVVMAVFANTPCDWWCASTNKEDGVAESDRLNAQEFNKKFAFSTISGNSTARFAWDDLKKIAVNYMRKVGLKGQQNLGVKNDVLETTWQDCWDELDWDGETSDFCGIQSLSGETDDLFDVDRKFLYGYWRDCFAPRQQLFLVFVRAEPIMMGGGAIGQTPPQLGARAMALVWRDPKINTDDTIPHRTRILYYRQFE